MIYTFHFDLTGWVEIEADSPNEALDLFDEIDDYSEHVNSTDAYNVVIFDEDGNCVEDYT